MMPVEGQCHILHVTHNMDIGGTEQVIKQIVSELDSHRFVSSIVCIDGKVGEVGKQLMAKGISVHSISRGSGFDRSSIVELRMLIKETEATVVHCHQYTPFCYGAFASVLLGVKVVFTEHGRFYPDRYTWKRRMINQLLCRMANNITCISRATREALHTFEWIPRSRVDVIYNGVKVPVYSSENENVRSILKIKPGTLVLGTISRFDSIKNQVMMIKGLASFRKVHSDVALIMAGDGPERARLEALTRELDLVDNVHFTGFISNIGDYLNAMDIFLLTSFSEGTSMTLLEAMAAGKVILATAVGGNVEVIDHDVTGRLVKSDDTQALINELVDLSADSMKRLQLSDAAKVRFEESFSVEKMIEAYQTIYLMP